jgi:hypothetical protein
MFKLPARYPRRREKQHVAHDVNELWRLVARNYESMDAKAPAGHKARVFVHLADDPATPILVNGVESDRNRSVILLHSMLEDTLEDADPQLAMLSERLVFVDESTVTRVEIRYILSEHSTGFTLYAASRELDGTAE